MIYAIHSTLNGIIPLLTVRINGLMVFGDLSRMGIRAEIKKCCHKQHFSNWLFVIRIKYVIKMQYH